MPAARLTISKFIVSLKKNKRSYNREDQIMDPVFFSGGQA
jgi:hypothetical protein